MFIVKNTYTNVIILSNTMRDPVIILLREIPYLLHILLNFFSVQYLNKIVSVYNIQFLGTKKVSLEDIKENTVRHTVC